MIQLIQSDLRKMQADVYDCNINNGWFEAGRSTGTDRALLHTEVAEMFEAFRDGGLADQTVTQREMRGRGIDFVDDSKTTYEPIENPKPLGVGSEAADVLVRWFDTATRQDFDVVLAHTQALNMHWPELLDEASEFGDWCDLLHRAVADTSGTAMIRPETAFAAALSILLAGCQRWDIELVAEFDRKLAYNRTRGYKHGGKAV